MSKKLTATQIGRFRHDGLVSPVDAFSPADAQRFRGLLEAEEARNGGRIEGPGRSKSYLYLPFLDQIVHEPAILDAVEDLIGPDILVLHSATWIKGPEGPAWVSWHQDSTYFRLEPALHVKMWVALSPSTVESGCVQVIPGSHRRGQLPHQFGRKEHNLLSQGQYVDVNLRETPPVHLELRPGQFSIHHEYAIHGSGPNRSADRRIGFGVSYVAPQVRTRLPVRLSAMLVRGADRYGNFDPETRVDPSDPDRGRAIHAEAMARYRAARTEAIEGVVPAS